MSFQMNKVFNLIVAYDSNQGIGKDNYIPWYYPDDLKRFKQLTLNQNVMMGYNTFKSILDRNGKPLPKRNNIILTHKKLDLEFDNCQVFNDPKDILNAYDSGWIIGGSQIYKLFLPYVKEIYVTEIKGNYDCDTFFIDPIRKNWKESYREDHSNYCLVNYTI